MDHFRTSPSGRGTVKRLVAACGREIGFVWVPEKEAIVHATITELVNVIREVNDKNGFNPVTHRHFALEENRIRSSIALIHSEIAEGTEAIRKKDKEGFCEEMADTLIRSFDMAGGLSAEVFAQCFRSDTLPGIINSLVEHSEEFILSDLMWENDAYRAGRHMDALHSATARISEHYHTVQPEKMLHALAAVSLLAIGSAMSLCDFPSVVYAKIAKNRTRGYRHGGKRL